MPRRPSRPRSRFPDAILAAWTSLAALAELPDDEARTRLDRWIAADRDDLDARVARLARIAANYHPGDPDRAARIAKLTEILARDPEPTSPLARALVVALADAGEPDRGREFLEAWPEAARDARFDRLRGRWDLDYDHNPARAAESFARALVDLPHDWKSHYGLARAYRAIGRDAEARARPRPSLSGFASGSRPPGPSAPASPPTSRSSTTLGRCSTCRPCAKVLNTHLADRGARPSHAHRRESRCRSPADHASMHHHAEPDRSWRCSIIAGRDTLARNANAIKPSVEPSAFEDPNGAPPMIDDLATLYAYNRWAEARMLDACRLVPPERYGDEPAPGWSSVRASVAHIAGATDLWTRRFQGQPADTFIPESELATPDAVARFSAATHDTLDRLIAGLSPDQIAGPFTYRNIKGQTCTVPFWAALRHVVNHATYHRGQVASKLKRLGVEPPITDFVYWVIEQAKPSG